MKVRALILATVFHAISATVIAEEESLKKACQVLKNSGTVEFAQHVSEYEALTKVLDWKKTDGTVFRGSYVEADETSVRFLSEDGKLLGINRSELVFNHRVRLVEIAKAMKKVNDDFAKFSADFKAKEDESRRKQAEEKKVRDAWNALPPAERALRQEITASANELSAAGSDQLNSKFRSLLTIGGRDEGLKAVLNLQFLRDKFLGRLSQHYAEKTLTVDVVKKIVNDTGGSEGVIHAVEALFFDNEKSAIPYIIVNREPLVTYLDVYLAAGRTLHADVREAYGFTQLKAFERMGDQRYWEYIVSERKKKLEAPKPAP